MIPRDYAFYFFVGFALTTALGCAMTGHMILGFVSIASLVVAGFFV